MSIRTHEFARSATARGFLAAVCVLPFAVPCAFALDAGDTLRVMTFNVRGCTNETGVRNVAQTANRILTENPDVLKFYTSADVATGYEEAGSATLSDDDFSESDTATAVIPLGTDAAKFYKAVIE